MSGKLNLILVFLISFLAIISGWERLLIAALAYDEVALVYQLRVADASLVVIAIIERVDSGKGDQVTRVGLDTLGEMLSLSLKECGYQG